MVSFEQHGDIRVIDLGDGDNRFNADTVADLHRALDEAEKSSGAAALVTTATGKIWSNGLDLDYMATLDDFVPFVADVQLIMARLLELPMPTVAAIQGHAFAGGAMLSLAHDVRIMRRDRGFFCLPEVDLGMSFGPGFAALIAAKVAQPGLHRLTLLGERLGAETAVQLGVIDHAEELDDVVPRAMQLATELAPKAKQIMAAIRGDYYGDAIAALKGE